MERFTAKAVAAEELADVNTFVVVLAENDDGSGNRLELQRALSFDEQDKKLGWDTYCLCTEWGATCHGGVTSWSLKDGSLSINLDAAAAATLGVDGGFEIALQADERSMAKLEAGLVRVFAGSE